MDGLDGFGVSMVLVRRDWGLQVAYADGRDSMSRSWRKLWGEDKKERISDHFTISKSPLLLFIILHV